MRNVFIFSIALMFCGLATVLMLQSSCAPEKNHGIYRHRDCHGALDAFYSCGFAATFDDIHPATFSQAMNSCQYGWGKMWEVFWRCYLQSETCGEFASCVPEHGFFTYDNPGFEWSTDDDSASDDDSSSPLN